MELIRRAVHLDFHTMPGIDDFDAGFDAAAFAETLSEAEVDYINVFAKCNLGFCYYPTRVGTPYPGLRGDRLGEIVKACHARGIRVTAYVNGGLDHDLLSRDIGLGKVNAQGQVIWGDRTSYGFRMPCYNNPRYRAYLQGIVREVAAYPVDGFFADCLFSTPCYCGFCLSDRKDKGLSLDDEAVATRHAQEAWLEFARYCKSVFPDGKRLLFNNVPYWLGRELHTHAEVECLPGGWSYDYFWPHAVFNRTFLPEVVYMTGRFQASWGDFGGLKTQASLENDCYDALCVGAGFMVGDHQHPARGLDPGIYRMVGRINAWLKTLEPHLAGSRPLAEMALLTDTIGWLHTRYWGATRLLCEEKASFEIVHRDADWSGYRLVVVPDGLAVDADLLARLRVWHVQGGYLLLCGDAAASWLQSDRGATDASRRNVGESASAWLRSGDADPVRAIPRRREGTPGYYRFAQPEPDLPSDMEYVIDADRSDPLPEGCGDALAWHVDPYHQRHWDGFHGYFYTPPRGPSGDLAAAVDGTVGLLEFDLFQAYYQRAALADKVLMRRLLDRLLPDPAIRPGDLPSTARATLARKADGTMLLHIKVDFPEVRGKMFVIEEHVVLPAGRTVQVRGSWTRALRLPDDLELAVRAEESAEGTYTVLTLPEITGYALIGLDGSQQFGGSPSDPHVCCVGSART